ncbi:MAG: hypothetical protein C4518_04550 [Desulfobacteraceae bacterium]|nr:MAG: hypothetical protein C4518_04550 [Desulfobacteraceae bacterium]
MRKSHFTIEQHQALGSGIKAAYIFLNALDPALKKNYPNDSSVVRLSDLVLKVFRTLQSELDELVYIENPALPNSVVNSCYFDCDGRCQNSVAKKADKP